MIRKALLALEDGTVFEGVAIGVDGLAVGEVVFNTAMSGYQEILTDPSYARQIITFTCPHIGNTGANDEDDESDRVWSSGLVIRDLPLRVSNWRSRESLPQFLERRGVVAIAEVDTRALTSRLRQSGSLSGAILAEPDPDPAVALAAARGFGGLQGMDLAQVVTTPGRYTWTQGDWRRGEGYREGSGAGPRVVVLDFGVKRNILRLLAERGAEVVVLPARSTIEDVLAERPDGVLLSNGPGDPEPCDYAIATIRALLERDVALFGICLGFQLLGLAVGGRTVKMPHGHHGANHPVKDLRTGKVLITSQNHGFAVDAASLPGDVEVTHVSLFDGSLQGMRHRQRFAFGLQGHPEASPGPHEAASLFDEFMTELHRRRAAAADQTGGDRAAS